MIKTIKYTFAIIALLAISTATHAGNTTFKAKLDSATLLMGNVVGMQMEIVQDKGKTGYILVNEGDTLTKNVEIVGWLKSDTSDIGNGREQINRTLILQSFDSGLYTLPPILYVAGRDTFKTNKLTLKVIPVDVDSLKDIHDYKTTEDPGSKWYDFLPDFITDYWWIYFVVLILLAIGLYIYYRIKKGKPILVCGSIQSRSYTDNQGNKRYVTEVVADEVGFVESKSEASGGASQYTPDAYTTPSYSNTNAAEPKFEPVTDEDDLPF